MTRETIEERIAIMQAYLDGQAIQSRYAIEDDWHDDPEPLFNWANYDYRIKPQHWRALYGDNYYYVDSDATIESSYDTRTGYDDCHYAAGNYFATREEAEPYLEEFKALFTKHK